VRKEYAVLREELARVVRRRARAIPDAAVDEALVVLNRVLDQGEEASLRGYWRARAAEREETLVTASRG
jgi:hypothetical protein